MGEKLLNTYVDTGWFKFLCVLFFLTLGIVVYFKATHITVDLLYFAVNILKICVVFAFAIVIYKISTYKIKDLYQHKKNHIINGDSKLNIFERSFDKIEKYGNWIEFGLFFSLILSNKSLVGRGGIFYNLFVYTYHVIVITLILFLIILSFEFIIQYCVE